MRHYQLEPYFLNLDFSKIFLDPLDTYFHVKEHNAFYKIFHQKAIFKDQCDLKLHQHMKYEKK